MRLILSSISDKKSQDNAVTFGLNENCTYGGDNVVFNEKGLPAFDVKKEGRLLCRVQLSVPGEHNILNALAAFACCHSLGIPTGVIKETLEAYHGTQRRFDIVGTTASGVKIVDDYAPSSYGDKRQRLQHVRIFLTISCGAYFSPTLIPGRWLCSTNLPTRSKRLMNWS